MRDDVCTINTKIWRRRIGKQGGDDMVSVMVMVMTMNTRDEEDVKTCLNVYVRVSDI